MKNEELLRKNYIKEEKIKEIKDKFNNELDALENNIKVEIDKYDFFKAIFCQDNNDIKKMLFEDYLKYFIIKYSEKKEIDYKMNENLFQFLLIIIKVKLSEKSHYDLQFTINEFIKTIIYIQGYKEDIYSLFDIYLDIKKYNNNIEEKMSELLDDTNIIKYEISERNKDYTKIVNITLFLIIESLLRCILVYSIALIKKDKNELFSNFYIY